MEMVELRYFLGVAKHESVQGAARELRISPGSLSKAIARLEDELGVKLFRREGRGLRITEHGRLLALRADEILRLEEAARREVLGDKGALHVVLTGAEVLLLRKGLDIARQIQERHPRASFEFITTSEENALAKVAKGEAQLALVASGAELPAGLASRSLGTTRFAVCVGRGHPLFPLAESGPAVPIATVLEHAFVCPSLPVFGKLLGQSAYDGWNDEAHPRTIGYVTTCLKLLEEVVTSGRALAYLPDHLAKRIDVKALPLSGCDVACEQEILLVAREPEQVGWLHALF